MAKSSPVSDTQALLQSMLQKLKLQVHSERSSSPTQEQTPSPATGLNGGSSSESTVYQFGDSMKSKQQGMPSNIWSNLDNPWSRQSSNQPKSAEEISATLKDRTPSWGFTNSSAAQDATSDADMPRWERTPVKISRIKVNDDSCSMSSFGTTHSTLNSTNLSTPSPASSILDWRTSEEHGSHSGVRREGVQLADVRRDDISVPEKQLPRTRTSRTSKKKLGDTGQKRWTQKVKERWKERHKKERDGKQKQEPNEVAKNNHYSTPTQFSENTESVSALTEEQNIIQPQPINIEAPPSPLDHMSENMFSFGSFNLMEEIFTGEEWAKFFQSSASSQPQSTCITPDKTTASLSSISQSTPREQTTGSQWDYKGAADSNLRMASSQMNSECFQQDMDITEHTFNQSRTSDISPSLSQMVDFPKDQSALFDLNQTQSMDLSLSQSENDEQQKYLPQSWDYQNYQSNTTEASVHKSMSSEQNLNQSQPSDQNHTQPESVHEEYLPLLDLSYLQPKDRSSLRMQGSLSRKRGHCTLRRASSDLGGSETGQVDRWRENAMIHLYSSRPAPSLSPASSISSLQHSFSQDSESSASIETVIKKRRLEDTRRVRFSEEVIFLPPLVLSDYDDDDDVDTEDEGEAVDEGEDDCQEELQSRSSVPSWLVALRTKTKKKSKFKLPQTPSSPIKFKSSKS